LVVRTEPGVGPHSEILEARLTTADEVYVVEGPVPADGYDWFLVAELAPLFGTELSVAAGWVAAASRDGEEWVVPVQPPCPDEVSVEAFASVPGGLLLYCFAGEALTLEGGLGFCAHGDPVTTQPRWLANEFCAFEAPGRSGESEWPTMYVHVSPDADVPGFTGEPRALRVTGRFDAPVARSCSYIDGAPEVPETPLDEQLLVFGCRSGFVVESGAIIKD
jgi:hypothetical protein